MNIIEAFEANKTKRVRFRYKDWNGQSAWLDVGYLENNSWSRKSILAEWEAEETPLRVEFECEWYRERDGGPTYPIAPELSKEFMDQFIGKKTRVIVEEIK